jgi:hypothetical protein
MACMWAAMERLGMEPLILWHGQLERGERDRGRGEAGGWVGSDRIGFEERATVSEESGRRVAVRLCKMRCQLCPEPGSVLA